MATSTTRARRWRAGWTAMLTAALCRGVLAMLVSLLVWSLVPAALGWHVTVVMSGSMEPALRPGDVVASRPVPADGVQPGQVLLVDDPDHAGRLRLHRLVKADSNGTLVLRGDANAADDSTPVRRNAVHGVGSLRVPFVGAPAYWARTHQPAKLAGGAALLVLLLAGAYARRVENDDEHDDQDADDSPGQTNGAAKLSPADAADPTGPAEEADTDIRRAAFARHRVRLTAIGAITAGLIAATTAAPALAAPFKGSTSTGNSWSAAASFSTGCGAAAVLADSPYLYFPLDEQSGSTVTDVSGNSRNGSYSATGVSHAEAGPCTGTARATTLNGSGLISTSQRIPAPGPTTFTEEIWFRGFDYRGGSLIGYASTASGTPTQYDRQLYVTNAGKLAFGVYTGSVKTISSPLSYNDGVWHLAAATVSGTGMRLYVDGRQVAVDTSVTSAENAAGYWRIGNSNFSGWPSEPTSPGFIGTVSGAAIYSTALSAKRIAAHYDAKS